MSNLQVFKNEQFGEIRIIEKDGQPWFVATDICKTLDIKNATQTIQRLDEDERSMFNIGRQGEANIVNEFGLYSLILSSRKPEAKEFKRWITHDVVPEIRKTGGYIPSNENDSDEDIMAKAFLIANKKIELLTLGNKQKDQLIGELKPRADYTDNILKNTGLVTITQIAKDYGMSGTKMNDLLHDLEVQYKQSNQWLLYTKHHDKGYTHSETIPITRSDGRKDISMLTKWTQKGRLFLYELLKVNEVLPVIEIKQVN